MRVALYARESSDDTSKAPSIAEQVTRGKQWAAEEGHEVVAIYDQDNGYSGGDWKRPGWNKSVNDGKRHLWVVLWVWNQDRLARDTEQFLWYYRQLSDAKCKIYEDTSNDFIDMSTLGGRVKHQSIAQAAEIFRLVTSEKVKKAFERKKRAGGAWGRRPVSFDIEKARLLHNRGFGFRKIAAELGGVSYQTIRRHLK